MARAHTARIAVIAWFAIAGAPRPIGATEARQITPSFADGRWLAPEEPIELRLSVPLHPEEGRLAVLIDRTDWTDLFEATALGLRLTPGPARLPRGESPVSIYLVSPAGEWTQLAEVPLRVLHSGGFEQVSAQPTVELSSQGQLAFDRQPAPLPDDRERFQDVKASLGILSTLTRGGLTTRSQANVIGVSNEAEALRFATEGAAAPVLDLADYLVDLEHRRLRLSVGHVQWDAHRQLVAGFGTRGVTAMIRFTPAVDLSLHAMNGTSIVGWSNFFGLREAEHQVRGATLGVELRPARPGALRVAASWLDGSLQPLAGFTEGLVNDLETSQGGALRVTATDAPGRLQVDAGYARSRFANPADALLAQGAALVPVRETTRSAQYLDASYALLQAAPVGRTQANLTAAVHHTRVEPLYRSVAASVQADQLQNTLELQGGIGAYASQFAWTDGRDNLDRLASLLTTTTRTATWTHALPLATLRREPASWLPALTASLAWQHQAGEAPAGNSLFNSDLSQVPDQANTVQELGLDWTGSAWRAGYKVSRSFQDNRQIGRERADFETLVHTAGLGLTPRPGFDLGLDLSFEDAESLEAATTDSTRRLGVSATWQARTRTTVTALASVTLTGNDPRTRDGRATDLDVQVGHALDLFRSHPDRLKAQLFVRFSRQTLRGNDTLFELVDRTDFWAVNTGVTFRVF